MKARVLLTVLLLVGVLGGVVGADVTLLNPGFEDPVCPGCPPTAIGWTPYNFGPPPGPNYYIYYYASAPTLVYEGNQSQSWYGSGLGEAGVYQSVTTGATPGETYEASVWFGDPGAYGATLFRIGIQPIPGPPTPGLVVYSDWMPVSTDWQRATVEVEAQSSGVTVVLEGMRDPSVGPGNWRVVVDNAGIVPGPIMLVPLLTSVPDACQPPNDPLKTGNVTNWCTPMAAVNMIWYWDQVVANPPSSGVDDGWVINTSAAYIGWWMDTNDLGCANRQNGHPPTYPSASGTYVADMALGLRDFVRWDATHSPCAGAPAMPPSKLGYDWKCLNYHNGVGMNNQATAWNQLKLELDEGRPLMVTWSYWVLKLQGAVTDPVTGVVYQDWDIPAAGGGGEVWNNPDNQSGQPKGDQQIGHTTTAIGYKQQYDPDGEPPDGGPLPKDNWVIVRDTWCNTPTAVAVPWISNQIGISPWVANTRGIPRGTLAVTAGCMNPANHWTPFTNVTNIMAQIRLTAGPSEGVTINSLTLAAAAGGPGASSINDIARVDVIGDTNSNGIQDGAEVVVATGKYAAPAPGSVTLNLNQVFVVPSKRSADLLVVYTMNAGLAAGRWYNFQLTAVGARGQRSLIVAPVNSGLSWSSPTKNLIAGPSTKIPSVPDTLVPPTNTLGFPNVNAWCAGTAAVNVTWYWDKVALDPRATNVNHNWVARTAAEYIGWWMDTNDFGCPFRMNGTFLAHAALGTYVGDIAPGITEFARWDLANNFGLVSPLVPPPAILPALPGNKNGYSWSVFTKHDATPGYGCAQAWTDMTREIDAGRPVLVTWRYWNPLMPAFVKDGIEWYDWNGPIQGAEGWNNWTNESAGGLGDGAIGHVTTVVGYIAAYDPDGIGIGKPLPTRDWVIVHDTTNLTGTDVAVPWWRRPPGDPLGQAQVWAANTFVRLCPPTVGSMSASPPNIMLANAWTFGGATVCVNSTKFSAGAIESGVVNVVTLTHLGTGNAQTDITNVAIYEDTNGNGSYDGAPGDKFLVSNLGYPAGGTLRMVIPGPKALEAPKAGSKWMFVVYTFAANATVGATFTCQVSGVNATGGTTFLPIPVNGLPITETQFTIGQIAPPPPPPHPDGIIDWWKQQRDGSWMLLPVDKAAVTTTAISGGTPVLGDRIYIEEEDRSCGIMMHFGSQAPPVGTLPVGHRVALEAFIDTINGERALVQAKISSATPGPAPLALVATNRAIGGGDWFYDPDYGNGQKGIKDAYGLNNIGLLVRTSGKVITSYAIAPPRWFTVGDGSGVVVKVGLPDPWVYSVPGPGEDVVVTGISSCEQDGGGDLTRLIRVRMGDDIQRPPH